MSPRTLAPAGTPISGAELATALRRGVALAFRGEGPGRSDPVSALERTVALRLGRRHAVAGVSGRALLAMLLEQLARHAPDRDEVVVPGYTCYSVAAAVARAGLRLRPVDLAPNSLDLDPEALHAIRGERVLALVATNLFGIPNDLPRLEAFCAERGIAFVDDAAQALGAEIAGRPVGSFGVAGLVSLDKGKNVTSLRGGLVATDDRALADRIRRRIHDGAPAGRGSQLADLLRLVGYAALLPPRRYWIADRLFDLGRTVYDPEFPIGPYPASLAPTALSLLDDLDSLGAARRERSARIADVLPPRVTIPCPAAGGELVAAALRVPVLFPSRETRDRALRSLTEAGLGASGYYPASLLDVADIRPILASGLAETPRARQVADSLLTLPSHPYVTPRDIDQMARWIRDSLS